MSTKQDLSERPDPFANSPDPLIDEVRAIRRRVWDADGGDMHAHVEMLRRIEKESGARVVPEPDTQSKRAG